MRFNIIDNALDVCSKHLDKTGSKSTEVEAYFTRYALILIYACFEERIHKVVYKKAAKVADADFATYVRSTSARVLQGIKIENLSGFLNKFSPEYKRLFQERIKDSHAQAAYSNLILGRHGVAHKPAAPVPITFGELRRDYPLSLLVLDAFAEAIGMPEEAQK